MTKSITPPQTSQDSWLRRKPVLNWLRKCYKGWRVRHMLPFNFGIHMVGIPLTIVGIVLLFLLPWYWGVGAFILGYVLQWIGHMAEGNDVGEWAAIKKMLGLPYVGVAPRWQNEVSNSTGQGQ